MRYVSWAPYPATPLFPYLGPHLVLLDVEGEHLLPAIAVVGQLILGHGGGWRRGGHTTTGQGPQPLRPKVEGLGCHFGAGESWGPRW